MSFIFDLTNVVWLPLKFQNENSSNKNVRLTSYKNLDLVDKH